jgi:hypothetical protein
MGGVTCVKCEHPAKGQPRPSRRGFSLLCRLVANVVPHPSFFNRDLASCSEMRLDAFVREREECLYELPILIDECCRGVWVVEDFNS